MGTEHATWRVGTLDNKHTPYEVFSTENGGRRIAVCHAKAEGDDTKANAHLIAAAPDLLEALVSVVQEMERGELVEICGQQWLSRIDHDTQEYRMGELRAILAKANGNA